VEQQLAHGQEAKHRSAPRGNAGVADMPSNRQGGGDTPAGTEKSSRDPSEVKPKQIEPLGRDRLGRRTAAMATNGGETDKSPQSVETAWRGRANALHGDSRACRSSPEPSDKVVGDS
jgi:hypothetical protein